MREIFELPATLNWSQFNEYFVNDSNNTLIIWIDRNDFYHLDKTDIIQVFSRYGNIKSVEISQDGNYALVEFSLYNSVLDAIRDLDGRNLMGIPGKLRVQLYEKNSVPKWKWNTDISDSQKQNIIKKFTIRYDVQIDPDNGFDVAKRIIGLKGVNMKRIHQLTKAKLRLRGTGSGYLEGNDKKEAPEPLHLCISCQNQASYINSRRLVEELLLDIYKKYDLWRLDSGLSSLQLKPKCYETLIPDVSNQMTSPKDIFTQKDAFEQFDDDNINLGNLHDYSNLNSSVNSVNNYDIFPHSESNPTPQYLPSDQRNALSNFLKSLNISSNDFSFPSELNLDHTMNNLQNEPTTYDLQTLISLISSLKSIGNKYNLVT